MIRIGKKSNSDDKPHHEMFEELCALATSGTLTDREGEQLKTHLAHCPDCGRLVQEYREISRTGMSLLMPEVTCDHEAANQDSWSVEGAKQQLFERIAREEPALEYRRGVEMPQKETGWRRWLLGTAPLRPLRYVSAMLVIIALVAGAFRLGIRRAEARADHREESSTASLKSILAQFVQVSQERSALDDQLKARIAEREETLRQLRFQAQETERWKTLQQQTAGEMGKQKSALIMVQSQYEASLSQLNALKAKLDDSTTSLQAAQKRVAALSEEASSRQLRTADLEAEVQQLSNHLRKTESTVEQQQQYLAADRDIRELMGARSLYIADVYDVSRDGQTQKPHGRVFYTKGKSLIFYAFDLDQQPRLRDASTFQAWGRHGLSDVRPLNMGIFYLDNEANKRWVLRFDNPDALAQIDAVFVTVEPRGGSKKPSGKQLLFASLRSNPNHP